MKQVTYTKSNLPRDREMASLSAVPSSNCLTTSTEKIDRPGKGDLTRSARPSSQA